MRPQRIQLSRRKGFDLQAISLALNGLPARTVARPGRWGNPFSIAEVQEELGVGPLEAQAEAVSRYRRWAAGEQGLHPDPPPAAEAIRRELAGKNLACWCGIGEPCHAEVLLEIANMERTP